MRKTILKLYYIFEKPYKGSLYLVLILKSSNNINISNFYQNTLLYIELEVKCNQSKKLISKFKTLNKLIDIELDV